MIRNETSNRRPFVIAWMLVALTAGFTAFAFQGSRGIYETSEGRYSECAREMAESGNWLEPTLDGRPHWTKPPGTYWAIAGGMRVFGQNAWGVRSPNALAFLVTALVTALIGVRLFSQTTGIVAGLIFASSPVTVFGAHSCTADMLLTLWIALTILCFVLALTAASRAAAQGWLTLGGVAAGLGFLTKGPPALLPVLGLAAWQGLHRPARLPRLSIPAVAAFLVVGLSWYLAVIRLHPDLLRRFLLDEVVGHVVSTTSHNRALWKSLPVYGPTLLLGAGAWAWFGLRHLFQHRLWNPRILLAKSRSSPEDGLLAALVLIPLTVFIFSSSRLQLYLLPLFVPLSIVLARCITVRAPAASPIPGNVAVIALASAMVLITVKGVGAQINHSRDMRRLHEFCAPWLSPRTRIIAIDRAKMFGLQFYLKGRLEHASLQATRKPGEMPIKALMDSLASTNRPEFVLVTDRKTQPELEKRLTAANIPHSVHGNRHWRLFVIPPASAPVDIR